MNKFLSVLLFVFSYGVVAQDLLPIEAFGSLPKTSMMRVSPSGDRIAYRVADASVDKDFYMVYDLKQKKSVAAIDLSAIRPSTAYFVDDDHLILVAEENAKLWGYRGRHDVSAAFSYNISNNYLKQLLQRGNGIYEGQTAIGRVVGVSTDAKSVYMPAWENAGNFNLFASKLDSKKKPKRVAKGRTDSIDFFVHNDQVVARERFNDRDNTHRIEVYEDGDWREIFRQEEVELRTKSFVGLTADIKHLVMLQHNANGRVAYYTMALADGKIAGPLFEQQDKDVEYVLSDINRIVYGVRYSGFTPSYDFFDATIKKTIDDVVAMMPDNSVTLVDHTPDWKKMIFLVEGNGSAGDYYMYGSDGFSFLASQRPDIPGEKVSQIFQTKIKARDGLKIPTLLTLPNSELKNLPAIMLPHGGPESYDTIHFDWLAQFFASRGYLVIQPQFRGSDGFGSDFKHKGRGEWGRKMQDDLTDTIRTLVKSGYVNKDRICIVGASYGGYAALAGAAFTPDVYKCAVSINGVADIERMMRDEKRDYGSDHWVVAYWQKVISEGNVADDHLEQISPINHVSNIKIPVMLIHGEHDEVVPAHQSENMAEELEDNSRSVQYIELEKGDHFLSNGNNRMKALQAIDKFISENI
ncbi:S9 family peptidase [Thalassotalea sp. HSM 43]|uniref:alpha/beta hydrolase family protein n=1 Tax=Thalassotalea sp. HSM 43 TaxID=2552945 RepID=UPI001080D029|nr:alpha/beta fold hydrolase [Thalassotalea sp. HSM 43]QBY03979.1 S9 family peptidase [Thalassotalea sp. HSM 43]